jgi:hypothetical protein
VAFIEPVPEGQVTGAVAEAYAADLAEDGYVSNVSRTFSHRPDVLEAWIALKSAVAQTMDPRRYELVRSPQRGGCARATACSPTAAC